MAFALNKTFVVHSDNAFGRTLCQPRWVRLYYIVLFLLLWEIGARLYSDPLFMSPPSDIVRGIVIILFDPNIQRALELAFVEIAVAFVLSVTIGLAIGFAIGLNRYVYHVFYKGILILYGVPKVVVFPLIILSFGIGANAKIAFGLVHGVFPILVAVVSGVQSYNPILAKAASAMGAKRWHFLRWVIVPQLVPVLFTGMRLAMSGVLLGVILAELYVSSLGIGYYAIRFSQNFHPAKLFALVGVLAFMAIVLNEMLRRVEVRVNRWRLAAQS